MHPTPSPSPLAQQSSFSEPVELLALVGKLQQKIVTLRRQVAWSDGPAELAVCLDRTLCQTHRHRAQFADDLSSARHQPLRLLRRCLATH